MKSARLNQLHNLAVSVAKWYDEALEADSLDISSTSILGNMKVPEDGQWHCLANVKGIGYFQNQSPDIYIGANSIPTDNVNLAKKYGLNSDDVLLYREVAVFPIDYMRNSEWCKDSTSPCFTMTNEGKLKMNLSSSDNLFTTNANYYMRLNKVCSSIRIVDKKAEVLLIAKKGGKFDTGQKWNAYASSAGSTGYDYVLDNNGNAYLN